MIRTCEREEISQLRITKVVKHVTKYVRNGWQHVVRHMCESSAALYVQKDATILCPLFVYNTYDRKTDLENCNILGVFAIDHYT